MISIIIPTYIKKQLLQNISKNMQFFTGCEVIVVNDNPKESLKDDLKAFKNFTLIENNQNLGFARSVNRGVRKAAKKYVLLLNDDVLLFDDTYKNAIGLFEKNPLLFAVSFAQKERDNAIVGKNILYWKKGLIFHAKAKDMKFGYNAWADGGSCLIDKNKFLQLGGFDSIYTPFYWEDIDLSYHAWKQGYKILFDPTILVQHRHESTIGKYYSQRFIKITAYRNQLIFIWKNITDPLFLLQHFLFLPYNCIYYLFKGEKEFILGFVDALKTINPIFTKRRIDNLKISDRKILSQFSL